MCDCCKTRETKVTPKCLCLFECILNMCVFLSSCVCMRERELQRETVPLMSTLNSVLVPVYYEYIKNF